MNPDNHSPGPPDTKGPLVDELAAVLERELQTVFEGAREDIAALATRLAANATLAVASGRPDLVQETRDAARALAEAQRLRAVDSGWDIFDSVVGTLLGTLVAVGRAA